MDFSSEENLVARISKDNESANIEQIISFEEGIEQKSFFESHYKSLKEFAAEAYEYASKLAESAKGVIETLNRDYVRGYTDKLVNEIEDWGYAYFSTVFKKLKRMSPLGSIAYYLKCMYVVVLKEPK